MKRNLTLSGGIIAGLMFIPIIMDAIRGASFNPVSFLLWSGLSLVLTLVLIKSGDSWILPACWVVSDCIVGTVLLFGLHQKTTFGTHEIVITVLIVVCTVVWLTTKTWVATVACTTALVLAALPQTFDIYRHPEHASWKIWAIYSVSNTLAFLGGQRWNIEDRLPAGISMVMCVIMTHLSLR